MAGKSFDPIQQGTATAYPTWCNNAPPAAIATVANVTISTVPVAGTIFYGQLWLDQGKRVTKMGLLNAATVGTDKVILAIYNEAGKPIANTATAGTLTSGANAVQEISLATAINLPGPALYYVSVSYNGTTDRFLSGPANGGRGSSQTGTFGTLDAITTLPTASGACPFVYIL